MKKETIEKLFKRYISIFDDVVYQTTNEHLDQTIKDEIYSEIDQIFKEYEQMSNLTEFNSFSEKIQNIINKVLKKSKNLNQEIIEKELQEKFNMLESNPFVYIQKEIDDTINKIVPNTNGTYYIPANPNLLAIQNKYRIVFESNKIQKHIEKYIEEEKAKTERLIQLNKEEYDEVLTKSLREINDYPPQFCKETLAKYFYNDNLTNELVKLPNSIKNYIIIDTINLGFKPHTEEYEKALELAFTSKSKFKNEIIHGLDRQNCLNDLKYNYIDNLISRVEVINDFLTMYQQISRNEGLTKSQKTILERKLNIVMNNIDEILDVSIIRFYKFMLEHNLFKIDVDFLTDKLNASLVYNMMNINLTLLINELNTVKLSKEFGEFILNKKYINIINAYYANKELKGCLDNSILKIAILDNLVETFNKQYKYKYILDNIKSKIKNIIKIKK